MKRASIDLGTNTCLLLIKDGDQILHDETNVIRLGQGVDQNGAFSAEAMARAQVCLTAYAKTVIQFGVKTSDVVAVGTAQARDARNAKDFFASIEKSLGFHFKVLSGDEEAKATFSGAALPGMDLAKMVVLDIGGGSTELVSAKGGKSLNLGAVRMTERFLKSDPVTDEEFWACEDAIDRELDQMVEWRRKLDSQCELVAVAGTAVTLAMLQLASPKYDRAQIDGFKIFRGDAHRLVEE